MKSYPSSILTVILTILMLSSATDGATQGILNRVLKRSKDKIEDKVEQAIVEKASEAIARRVYRSMSDAFDQMLRDAWRQDSIEYASRGDTLGRNYNDWAATWMQRMNEAVDLPPSFDFDMRVDALIENDKESNMVRMYLSKSQSIFAMEQDEKKEKRIFLIDAEKDVVILYMEDKKGNKTAQAIPNMMGAAVGLASQQNYDTGEWQFEKMNKSKTIAGYKGEGYRTWDDSYESEVYITRDLDIDWRSAFGGMVEKFAASNSISKAHEMQGFMLEAHTISKDKPKDSTSWITQEISNQPFKIQNSDYTFGNMMNQD
ncbi:MAG: hypothetical protein OEQ53_23125 [Saprospiraceae bacterium]|nr:hypothetical protein [Saprospiraceae bacterium]